MKPTYLLLVVLVSSSTAIGSHLDKTFSVASLDEALRFSGRIIREAPTAEGFGLDTTFRAIKRNCDRVPSLNPSQREALLLEVLNGRTIREIIVIGANILLAESAELDRKYMGADIHALQGTEKADYHWLTNCRALGVAFLETYARRESGRTEENVREQ